MLLTLSWDYYFNRWYALMQASCTCALWPIGFVLLLKLFGRWQCRWLHFTPKLFKLLTFCKLSFYVCFDAVLCFKEPHKKFVLYSQVRQFRQWYIPPVLTPVGFNSHLLLVTKNSTLQAVLTETQISKLSHVLLSSRPGHQFLKLKLFVCDIQTSGVSVNFSCVTVSEGWR